MAVDLKLLRVLVVDDFSNMRSTIRQMLLSIGIKQIDVAADGEQAVDMLSSGYYDIVLCDYNLGEGKDGQQVLEEAKVRKLVGPSTIFFMITAENKSKMVMAAVEYQPDDYLTKPFTKEHLRTRLERHIARKADLGTIESAMQREDYRRALAICNQQIAKKPKRIGELLKLKGELCLQVHRYDEAQELFKQVLKERSVPWALVGMGRIRFMLRKFTEAKRTFESVIEEHPTYMEAYDWLAKTLKLLGESERAQQVLASAIDRSPKAIVRQDALGDVASENEDYETAAGAYRRTVKLGKHSVYRSPDHYSKLAKAQANTGSVLDVVKTLHGLRREFKGDEKATLQAAVTEGLVYKQLKREREAESAFAEASSLWEKHGDESSTAVRMDMAKVCLHFGENDRGIKLMESVIKNNHEDNRLLEEVQKAFDAFGMTKEGEYAIARATGEVRNLNNRGVNLVKADKIDEAIRFFEEALEQMPDNPLLNLNAAQAMLMQVKTGGRDPETMSRIRQCLNQVKALDPTNPMLPNVLNAFEAVVASPEQREEESA